MQASKDIRRLQLIEIDILKVFIDVCSKLGLQYYVLGGTLLGAVRHKGFIPWDDDIDVGMLRKDYEVFIEKAPLLFPDHLFVQNYRTDKGYCMNITKIRNIQTTFIESDCRQQDIRHGVFLDVFPLDNFPVSRVSKWWFNLRKKALGLRIGRAFTWKEKSKIRKAVKALISAPLCLVWPNVKRALQVKEKLYKSYPYSGMIANICGQWGDREIVPAEWYGAGCDLIFEDIVVKAPKEYKKWLERVYGDYMTPPPVEKRVSHHGTTIIDLDQPYLNYVTSKEK